MDKNSLLKLNSGGCDLPNVPANTAVLVQPNVPNQPTCISPTESVTVDPNKVIAGDCPTAQFDITNNSGQNTTLLFGGTGMPGVYQLLETDPLAVDFPGVVSNDYTAGNNAMGLQRFNYFVRTTGIIATYIEFRNLSATQKNERIKVSSYFFDKDSTGVKISTPAPSCSPCFNNVDDVRRFEGKFFIDDMHYVSYVLKNEQNVVIEIGIGAQASARNYVACN